MTKRTLFDLSQLDTKAACEKGAELQLKHPGTRAVLKDADGEPLVIHVVGKHSDSYVKKSHALSNARFKRMRGGPHMTSEESEQEGIVLLTACVQSISENLDLDGSGSPVPNTPEGIRRLLSDPRFRWVREQVDEFVGELGNFLPE